MQALSSFLKYLLLFSLLLLSSCQNTNELAGKYESEDHGLQSSVSSTLELMPNGEGTLSTVEDNVSFKWEARGEKIMLHTKDGGVIIGKIDNGTVQIILPGMHPQRFKKMNE